MEKAKAGGQSGRGVHREIESGYHAAADVHRQRQPRSAEWLPRLLVDDEDVGLSMVDLDYIQRAGSAESPGDSRCLLQDLLFTAAPGALLEVNILEASRDRPAMRGFHSNRNAACLYVPDQLRNARSGSLQVVRADCGADDLLSLNVQDAMPLWPPTFTINQRQDSSASAKYLD